MEAEGQIKTPSRWYHNSAAHKDKQQVEQGTAKVEKNWWDRLSYGLLAFGASSFLLPLLMATCTPFVWITTHSLPWGIYRRTQEPIRRGILVHVCLPETLAAYALERAYIGAGPCPGVYQELLKPVAAVAGDAVEISVEGVSVNGHLLPGSPVFAADSAGRPHTVQMPQGQYIVPDGQVFLLSTFHPRSWDGRYFGFLPLAAVRGTVREVWMW